VFNHTAMQGTLRFVPRLNVIQKDGRVQLRFTYKLGSKRIFVNSGISVFPAQWDADNQRLIYLNRKEVKRLVPNLDFDLMPGQNDVDKLNGTLASIRSEVVNIETYFLVNNIPFSAEMVVNEYANRIGSKTKQEEQSNLVFDFIDRYV